MAFQVQNFQFGRGITSSYTQGQGVTTVTHAYKSDDTLAVINAGGYFPAGFDGDGDKVFVDDLLDICASDGTSRVRIDSLDPFTYGADLYSASGSSIVVGAPQAGASGNGANISGTTLHMEYGNATNPGIVSTGTQTFGGDKTFTGTVTADSGVMFSASGPSDLSYYEEGDHITTFFNNTITSAPITIHVVRIGGIVNLTIPADFTTGAQAAPTSTFTASTVLPAKWRPSGECSQYWPVLKNGVESRGEIFLNSGGAIQFSADVDNSVTFGNTSNTIYASTVTYNILT